MVAILALAALLVLVVDYGRLLQLLLLIALVDLAAVATRYGLGRDIASLKSGPTPGTLVGPAIRPVLLMNPRSGGGKVERFHLVEEARRRGIEAREVGQHQLGAWESDSRQSFPRSPRADQQQH